MCGYLDPAPPVPNPQAVPAARESDALHEQTVHDVISLDAMPHHARENVSAAQLPDETDRDALTDEVDRDWRRGRRTDDG